MMYPFVSVVIPTRNEEKNLPRLLRSLAKLDYPKNKLETIIVDGYSTDKTLQIAKRFKAKISYNPKIMRGAGCQIGVDQAQGEFVAFTDADCIVPSNWVKALMRWFDEDKKVAAVGGPNVTPSDDTPFAKAVGDVLTTLTSAGSRYGFAGKKVVEIYHNPGCNVVYRRQAIRAVGGFNTHLLTCEDEELDFRLRQKGFKLLFVPWVSVDHYRRSTYKQVFVQAYRFAIGRAQAIRLHWQMARWFHFTPSLLLFSLLPALFLTFTSTLWGIVGFFYVISIFLMIILGSIFLSFTRNHVSALEYLIIILYWTFGWSGGFTKGLIGGVNERGDGQDNQVKDTWANYWKNYHGVTKIGAWSQEQALKKVFSLIEDQGIDKNIKIIDVGCGEGRTLKTFREKGFKNSIGIDNTWESLAICQRNGLKLKKDVFFADACRTKFKDREFEMVFSEGLLEHFKNPIPIIEEMARISRRYILLIQPNHYSIAGRLVAILGLWLRGNVREHSFSKRYFVKQFGEFGFFLKAEKSTPLGEFFILLLAHSFPDS